MPGIANFWYRKPWADTDIASEILNLGYIELYSEDDIAPHLICFKECVN